MYIDLRLTHCDNEGTEIEVAQCDLHRQPMPLVILGDPGMGKTLLLRDFAARRGHPYLSVASFLRKAKKDIPPGPLILDAMDEVPAKREADPLDRLLEKLGDLGETQFLLSCRAADWHSSIHASAIENDIGQPVRVLTLQPFSEGQARLLLETNLGRNAADEFYHSLASHGLEPLLANPQTLSMLLEIAGDGVPNGRADLFGRAARKMVAEHNPQHVQSMLNQQDADTLLDGAGAAMAVLLLCGKEALYTGLQGRTLPHQQSLASVSGLPEAGAAGFALQSRLFRITGEDSFAACHRTMAEYLAARWIGRTIHGARQPDAMVRRLMSFLHEGGRVPASLRGLHAWLAYSTPYALDAVLAADPFGAIRFGDMGSLSRASAEKVWAALVQNSVADPWFRAGDWQRFSVCGLTQAGMGATLSDILTAEESGYHLRSLILDLLPGAACAPEMRTTLLNIVRDPDRSHSERHDAILVLSCWTGNDIDWPCEFLDLCRSGSRDGARLADEGLPMIGLDRFSDAQIADILFAQCGGYLELEGAHGPTSHFTDFWSMTRAVSVERSAAILDALVDRFENKEDPRPDGTEANGFNALVRTLIVMQVPGGPPDPLRLLRWLGLLHRADWGEQRLREHIATWLAGAPSLRQAIQGHLFLTEEGARARRRPHWYLGGLSAGLLLQEEDLFLLLERLSQDDVPDHLSRQTFEALVSAKQYLPEWSDRVAAAASHFAARDPALEQILHPPRRAIDAELQEDIARMNEEQEAGKRRRAARRAQDRAAYLNAIDAIRAGAGPIGALALRYLGEGVGDLRDMPPEDRIASWVGSDVCQAALVGFETSLKTTPSVAPGEATVRLIGSRDMHDRVWALLAGLAHRHARGVGFEDITEDILFEALIAKRCLLSISDSHFEGLGEALDRCATACERRFERFLRGLIAPQIAMDRSHIQGIYYLLLGREHPALRARLLIEWSEPLLARCLTERKRIVAALLDVPAPFRIRAEAHVDRLIAQAPPAWNGEPDPGYWLSMRFLRDFETSSPTLDEMAQSDPSFLWELQKAVGYDRRDRSTFRSVTIDQLVWLFRMGERHWPDTERPGGTTTGSRNGWDASEFLQAVLFRIAEDISLEAARALSSLIDDECSTYTEAKRAALARQCRKAVDANFTVPSLDMLAPLFREETPRTTRDVKAIVEDAIAGLQKRISGCSTDTVALFYEGGRPKPETACRNVLLDLLGTSLSFGIAWDPEVQMP